MQCCKMKSFMHSRVVPLFPIKSRKFCAVAIQKNESEPTEPEIEYPEIMDLSYRGKLRTKRKVWRDKIQNISTVEEKIFELNVPRYYGWQSMVVKEGCIPYNTIEQAQHVTRTYIHPEPRLPAYYDNIMSNEELDTAVKEIREQVEDFLSFEYSNKYWPDFSKQTGNVLNARVNEDNAKATDIALQMNRVLLINMAQRDPNLLAAETDIKPRVEASWFVGGIDPPDGLVKVKKSLDHLKEYANDEVNRMIHYDGSPILQVRQEFPLKEIISLKDSENQDWKIPMIRNDPRTLGHLLRRNNAVITPGFWPSHNQSQFGSISYHNCGYLHKRSKEYPDNEDALKTQAVYANFSFLYAQACYQGFSTFQDMTYPLVNQMAITNGQMWSLCAYQLNTTTLHIDAIHENPRRNICWMTEPMKLFDKISNGKVHGLNEEVLKLLIKFYANKPEPRLNVEMTPYLGKTKYIQDIEEDERRAWLEKHFKYTMTERKRHRLIPEIALWQKIYLIDNKTRPLHKRLDPWQFGFNIRRRRLDDHAKPYIPKALRAFPKSKKKFQKTYYP